MSSASKLAIPGSLPIGCCLVAPRPIQGVTASRLIHIQHTPPGQDLAWLVDLHSDKLPTSQPLSHLIAMVADGELTVWHWTPRNPVTLRNSLSHVAARQARSAWNRIKPLTSSQQLAAMLDENQRGQLIAQRAAEVGCGRTQIYRDWVRYLQNGMTPDALIPRIANLYRPPW